MKVRWDAVVDRSRFWTEASRPASASPASTQQITEPVTVNVWLYGSLARMVEKRPLALQLPQGSSVGDVLAELGRRFGEEFTDRVVGADGQKFSHCRVFVDGLRMEDMGLPVDKGPSPATVEIILLAAIEGG
ncbi:MAG: MoaD/ThiS family protein [Betaproteobacteria bacterium]|nr:MoaD/ThiS family protein [Betaproteobacteria bacterium]